MLLIIALPSILSPSSAMPDQKNKGYKAEASDLTILRFILELLAKGIFH